jgi:hypothetical protein
MEHHLQHNNKKPKNHIVIEHTTKKKAARHRMGVETRKLRGEQTRYRRLRGVAGKEKFKVFVRIWDKATKSNNSNSGLVPLLLVEEFI